ncbi:gas vesicle protein [Nocardiopsis sp. ATB16-24]|uniref:gas vesicle protein GvpO n=1 Tax=Nocardiopsis sp. ATB16-24 TaxID=3019555 RepID=UPI00255449F8|nr:gas vesicle protein [Nocardiopsis sp. ATB16-24]
MGQEDVREKGFRKRRGSSKSLAERVNATRDRFEELTGLQVESVSGFEPSEDGWNMTVETLELRRVPDTMSLLATYSVDLDSEGEIQGYHRAKRYTRTRSYGV